MSMILTGLAVGSGLLQIGGGFLQGNVMFREAAEQARKMQRAARFARADARSDLRMATAEIDAEETNMRMQATLQSQQLDAQQANLTDEAMEHAGMTLVGDSMRGVGGAGTMRSMMRGFRQRGRAQRSLGLERMAAFSSQRRAETMIGISRERSYEGFNRVARDTRQLEDDARKVLKRGIQGNQAHVASGIIAGGLSAGKMIYQGGGFNFGSSGFSAAQSQAIESSNINFADFNERGPGTPPRRDIPQKSFGYSAPPFNTFQPHNQRQQLDFMRFQFQ